MVLKIEEILQDVYEYYNNSAKRQGRLRELAETTGNRPQPPEDKVIDDLEIAIETTLKQGMSDYVSLLNICLIN